MFITTRRLAIENIGKERNDAQLLFHAILIQDSLIADFQNVRGRNVRLILVQCPCDDIL